MGISWSATYIRVRQTVTIRAPLKVIDANSGELIFDDSIRDYLKYWFAFQTQQRGQVIYKTEIDMMADLARHLPRRIAYALYPAGMPEVKEGEILLRPEVKLLGNQGVIAFD